MHNTAGNHCEGGKSGKERQNSFLSYIIYSIQVKVVHSVQSGGGLAAPAARCCAEARRVFVCDITVCCGKKASQRPADCAHRLPLCDFTGRAQSELGDLHKH